MSNFKSQIKDGVSLCGDRREETVILLIFIELPLKSNKVIKPIKRVEPVKPIEPIWAGSYLLTL